MGTDAVVIPRGIGTELGRAAGERTFADVAAQVVDLLFDLRHGSEPAFALVRAYRLGVCAAVDAELLRRAAPDAAPTERCLTLVATRGTTPAWNDVASSAAHRVLLLSPSALSRTPMVAELTRQLALAPSSEHRTATFHVADAETSAHVPAKDFVRDQGVRSILGFGVDVPNESGLVVLAFARAHAPSAAMRTLEVLGLRTKRALLDAVDVRLALGDAERARMHVAVLERIVELQDAQADDMLTDARREQLARAAAGELEIAKRETELREHNEKLRRTQRAILNVIDDLREARATLATRVEERTKRIVEILDETQDSFFALDANMRFTMMNARHEAMLGVNRAKSLGRSYYELFETPRESKLWSELHRVRDERVLATFVELHPTAQIWVEASASPSSDGGIAVFYRDITQRVRLEREREEILAKEHRARIDAEAAWAQAESANRMKDEFLSTVSHELRTPLNAILGWSQLLVTERLEAAQRTRALETIERNARAQVRLVEDLLDFGRIVQGKFRLAVGPVEVVRVVEGALQALAPAADAKGVRIQSALDSHATIVGDGERVQQIVWNLVSNAIKFTPRGGRVHVSLRRATSYVEIAVADDGQGIAADFLPHVFEPFRQADGAIARRAGGLGLGLSIVRSLVEMHGGTVTARSEGEGRGATFTVRIPIAPIRALDDDKAAPSSGSQRPRFEQPPALAGIRALVLDDEKDTRELVAFVLEQCNAAVTTAANTREASTLLDQSAFDVIVSDVGMPEEDGLTWIRRVRKRTAESGGTLPAVALTAYSRSEDRTDAIRAGFDAHLSKPVDASELALVVAAVLRKRR